MKKTIFTLNIEYSEEICAMTYPLIYRYADKIGADVAVITHRKSPDMPVTYEKLQIFDAAKQLGSDWIIYVDSDALIHPELPDLTVLVPMDTVMHNGADMAAVRWRYDDYFRRDGRHIGSCNWLAVASRWCLDLWHPMDDITLEEALTNITPTASELKAGITKEHLIDDYLLSRNIARYGLKYERLMDVLPEGRVGGAQFFWHQYTIPIDEKIVEMRKVLKTWGV
jgi:hypothetical protein